TRPARQTWAYFKKIHLVIADKSLEKKSTVVHSQTRHHLLKPVVNLLKVHIDIPRRKVITRRLRRFSELLVVHQPVGHGRKTHFSVLDGQVQVNIIPNNEFLHHHFTDGRKTQRLFHSGL